MGNWIANTALVAALIGTAVFASVSAHGATPAAQGAQCGKASWYAMNTRTASGERMDPSQMTAAHRNLRFGTRLKVTNSRNGKSVIVRINDRGPFVNGRIIDVSKAAASKLGFVNSGHTHVCVERIG